MKSTYLQLEIELAKTKAELAETKAELAETKRRLDEATQLLKQALEEITNLKEQLKLNSKIAPGHHRPTTRQIRLPKSIRSVCPEKALPALHVLRKGLTSESIALLKCVPIVVLMLF